MNIALTLAYEGTSFFGWQKTKYGPSVEGVLENTIKKILQHNVVLQAASRTDRGVHAAGQVVNFFTEKPLSVAKLNELKNSLNDLLPKEIVIKHIDSKPYTFHPTLDCKKKEYRYYICNSSYQLPWYRHFSWHCYKPLNIAEMNSATLYLLGEKDFSAFCNQKKNETYSSKVRTVIDIQILQIPEDRIEIRITGNNFLYKMVRNLVGTLVYIGLGKIDKNNLQDFFTQKDRTQIGVTAPSKGLFLYEIFYD
jgi:tRNA pseudouridine38-40 synthase